MKFTPNQIEALKRFREGGQFSPYSREYMTNLDSMDKRNVQQPSSFTLPPLTGSNNFNMGEFGKFNRGEMPLVPKSPLSNGNDLTLPEIGFDRPQYPERFSLTAAPQTEQIVEKKPEEKKFDGAKAYLDWYANKVNSEPIRFASIRDKLEKGW